MYMEFQGRPGMATATYSPDVKGFGPQTKLCFHDIVIELCIDDEGKFFDALGRFKGCTRDEAEEEISFNLRLANSRF